MMHKMEFSVALAAGVLLLAGSALWLRNTGSIATTESDPPKQSTSTAPRPKEKMLTWQTLDIEEQSPKREDKLVLSDEEWKKRLSTDAYNILRKHGTEPAFCGVNLDQKGSGIYHCAGCNLELFVSDNKYKSGTGWPSFYLPYARKNLWFKTDRSYGMERVEVLCARCDGHLGHVFPDGPEPSGLRFCINGNALKFVEDK